MQPDEPVLNKVSPVAPSGSSNWKRTAIAIIITAFLTGTGGYLLGVNASSSTFEDTEKAAFQPSATTTDLAYATPTLNPTADWEIYTNTKYGYSIKYPRHWHIAIDIDQKKEPIVGVDKEDFILLTPDPPCLHLCGGYRPSGVYLDAGKTSSQSSLAYVKQNILTDFPETKDHIKSADLNNIDGTIVSGFYTGGCTGPNLYIVKNRLLITIETECVDAKTGGQGFDSFAAQVFASFKFAD